jgi:hypothetical protein
MKYLKNYSLFKEDNEFEVNSTDRSDIQSAKERLNNIKNDISEYKSKKSEIDRLYLNAVTDEDIKTKLKSLLGENNKNQFMSSYLHISELKRRINKFQNDISEDKLKKDDFGTQISNSEDPSIKSALSDKIKEIDNRISTKTSDISSLKKEIDDSQRELDKKMKETETEMLDNFKKISTENI